MLDTKQCGICLENKSLDTFRIINKKGKKIIFTYCRPCERLYNLKKANPQLRKLHREEVAKENTKICTKCNLTKSLNEFYKRKNRVIKYMSHCKKCITNSASSQKSYQKRKIIECVCVICSQIFMKAPEKVKQICCSRNCSVIYKSITYSGQNSWYARNPEKAIIAKEKNSKTQIKLYSTGQKTAYKRDGNLNPNWRGGISCLPYGPEFSPKYKSIIKNRDNFTCQNCETIQNLSIHHIDHNKLNNQPYNLITLCKSCNSKANGHKFDWETYYCDKINKIYGDGFLEKEKVLCNIEQI
ncbi:MAG: hypothetical protein AABY22_24620 [Nanoarchaeota archaeon]